MNVVIDPTLEATLIRMATAKIRHPIEHTSQFVDLPILLTLSIVNGIPTVTLAKNGNEWPYKAEPTLKFDDRQLA